MKLETETVKIIAKNKKLRPGWKIKMGLCGSYVCYNIYDKQRKEIKKSKGHAGLRKLDKLIELK